MAKIFFPFIDQPKQFPFLYGRSIRFPFIVENLVYYWDFNTQGITLYLNSQDMTPDAPVLKDILLEDTGITFYLDNSNSGAGTSLVKSVLVTFEQIGRGLQTLGMIDPLTLGDIDPFKLGEISTISADWMALKTSIVSTAKKIIEDGGDIQMCLGSNTTIAVDRAVFTGELSSVFYLTGLQKYRTAVLGELDPRILDDIDVMLSTFGAFEDVPASLVKGIYVSDVNALRNTVRDCLVDVRIDSIASKSTMAIVNGSCAIELNNTENIAPEEIAMTISNSDIEITLDDE